MDNEATHLLEDPELTPQFAALKNTPTPDLFDLERDKKLTNLNRVENLLRIAIPVIIQRIFFIIWETVTMIFVGQFTDSTTLSAVGLSNMWINVTTAAVIIGIRDALETCCSIEIGKGNLREAGLLFHKGLFMSWGVAAIMLLVGFRLESILVFFGQDPLVCAEVGKSIIWYSLYMFPYAFDCAFSALLQCQQILKPQNYAITISMIFHPLWCYIFIYHLQLKSTGAGLTYITSSIFSSLLVYTCAKIDNPHNLAVFFPTRDSFRKYKWIATVAFQSSILLCLQWWIPEIGTFMVGLLNKYQLAAHICGYQIQMFFCIFPNIIHSAAITLMGNYIGQGNKREFRKTSRVAIVLGIFLTLASIVTVLPFRSFLAKVISNDAIVIQITYDLLPFVFLYVFFDGVQTLIGSIFKALGRYGPALNFTLLNCYLVGIPFSWLFGLKMDMGVNGIWLGFVVGFVGTIIFYGFYVWKMDYDVEIDNVLKESEVKSFNEIANEDTSEEIVVKE